MPNLIDSYHRYYQSPTGNTLADLIAAINNYDFANYNKDIALIAKFYQAVQGDFSYEFLRSSGSSGESRSYRFGPFLSDWWGWFEKRIKRLTDARSCMLNERFFFPKTHTTELISKSHLLYDYVHFVNIHEDNYQDAFFENIENLYERVGPISVSGLPSFFLQAFQGSMLPWFLENKRFFKCICTTGWEPFYKRKALMEAGFWFNDNLINWFTGVNFYTCQFHQKHFLPTFAVLQNGYLNLINLSDRKLKSLDDMFLVGERVLCQCGRYRLPVNFLPHVDYIIQRDGKSVFDLEIIEDLDSPLIGLQFIQQESGIDVVYSTHDDLSQHDKEYLLEYWPGARFLINRYHETGNAKAPAFWRNKNNRRHSMYQKSIFKPYL